MTIIIIFMAIRADVVSEWLCSLPDVVDLQ